MKERFRSFLELTKNDIQAAKSLFFSQEFKDQYLKDDEKLAGYYDELLKGKNRNQILEEFLIYTELKQPISYYAEQEQYTFGSSEPVTVKILQNGWGYEEISILSDADVILSHTLITSEDFVDGAFEITVDSGKISKDLKSFQVILKTDYEDTVLTFERQESAKADNRSLLPDLEQYYVDFRCGTATLEEYEKKTLERLESDHSMLAELIRLFMDILMGRMADAGSRIQAIHDTAPWIVKTETAGDIYNRVGTNTSEPAARPEDYKLEDGFYSYLLALFDHNPLTIKAAVEHITELKNSGEENSAFVWMLLYLDESLALSGKKQLIALEELFQEGGLSDALKYEVCGNWNRNPLSLKVISQFTTVSLSFGLSKNILSKEVYDQFARVLRRVDSFVGEGFYLLEKIYEMYPEEEYLQSLVKTILRTGQWDVRYHKYLKEAVNRGLNIVGVYEAYIHTISKDSYEILSPAIFHYFSYSNSLSMEEQAYLYANADRNKNEYGTIAGSYLQKMQYQIIRMMENGIMTDATVMLYEKYFPDIMNSAAGMLAVPDILFKRKVICNNANMKYLVVKHFEKDQADIYHLANGIAYPDIYSDEAICYFMDERKDPHLGGIEWKMERLWKEEKYYETCYEQNPYHEKLLLKKAHNFLKKSELTEADTKTAVQLMDFLLLSDEAKELILELLLQYYYKEQDYRKLNHLLSQVRWDKIQYQNRNAIIEYFISQKHYDDAVKGMERFGFDAVDPELLLDVSSYLLTKVRGRKSPFVQAMCGKLIREDCYDVDTVAYLQRYASPEDEGAVELWEKGKSADYYNNKFTEQLLKHFAKEGGMEERMLPIFLYYIGGGQPDLSFVERCIERFGRWYFANGKQLPEEYFAYLTGYFGSFGWSESVGPLSWLHYFSKQKELNEEQKDLIEEMIFSFVLNNLCLAFFLKFEGRVKLPKVLYSMTFVTYKGKEDLNVTLHWQLKRGEDAACCPMYEVLDGIYIATVRVFSDEHPDYYITMDGDERKFRKSLIVEADHVKSVGTKFHKINEVASMISEDEVYPLMDAMEETAFMLNEMLEPWSK